MQSVSPRHGPAFLAFVLLLCPTGSSGDMALRAASRYQTAAAAAKQAGSASPPTQPGGSRVTVQLRRVTARPLEGGGLLGSDAVFYVGNVMVGHAPDAQEMSVLFDTASGNVVLPAARCKAAACSGKRRYTGLKSPSARRINMDGRPVRKGDVFVDGIDLDFAQIDLGEGYVNGTMVEDSVCVGAQGGSQLCTRLGVVVAHDMTAVPFRSMPHDGLVGLGLDALTAASPLFNFLRRFSADSELLPQFGLSLRGPRGELTFGGPGPAQSRVSPTAWVPVVHPEEGYWQVRIEAIRVDDRTADACPGGCRAIIDTGASRLGVPAALAPRLGAMLAATPVAGGGCRGPKLHFDLGGGSVLTLYPEDYAGPGCGDSSRLAPLMLQPAEYFKGLFVFGQSVLQRYDTVYDWGSKHVGFSLATPRAVRLGPPTTSGTGPERPRDQVVDVMV